MYLLYVSPRGQAAPGQGGRSLRVLGAGGPERGDTGAGWGTGPRGHRGGPGAAHALCAPAGMPADPQAPGGAVSGGSGGWGSRGAGGAGAAAAAGRFSSGCAVPGPAGWGGASRPLGSARSASSARCSGAGVAVRARTVLPGGCPGRRFASPASRRCAVGLASLFGGTWARLCFQAQRGARWCELAALTLVFGP